MLYPGSFQRREGLSYALAKTADGQRVFVAQGSAGAAPPLGEPLATMESGNGRLLVFATDAAVIDRFCRLVAPPKGPVALGSTPRLGIGCRMSTAVWPGVWAAMGRGGFASNAIQNSLRELSLLSELELGIPPRSNYQFSFGSVQEGHTGATFEGLWTEGVLSAIASGQPLRYGADADHIMVKRTPDGLERARSIIDSARFYSFFTLDVSDLLDYEALSQESSTASLETLIPDGIERKMILRFHGETRRAGGGDYSPGEERLAGLVGKYWAALDAAQALASHLAELKGSVRFDLELSIDENPPGINTCDCLTSPEELIFLLVEAQRRGLPLTHVAPNFGIEKGTDYRCPGGLGELEARAGLLYRIAEEHGVMLDCHSGDDLEKATRQAMGRAARGRIHFKVSPSLQVLFGEVLHELAPDVFRFWWEDTLDYVKREAASGSEMAETALVELAQRGGEASAKAAVFHHFGFATVGRKDNTNKLLNRERFYGLPQSVYAAYTSRLADRLVEVAEDVFEPGGRDE
jgi:hypothetical protein